MNLESWNLGMKMHPVPAGLIYGNRERNVLELNQGNLPLNENIDRRTLRANGNLGNYENLLRMQLQLQNEGI